MQQGSQVSEVKDELQIACPEYGRSTVAALTAHQSFSTRPLVAMYVQRIAWCQLGPARCRVAKRPTSTSILNRDCAEKLNYELSVN